jgi:hypothetical protein
LRHVSEHGSDRRSEQHGLIAICIRGNRADLRADGEKKNGQRN